MYCIIINNALTLSISNITWGSLALGVVGSHNRPVATPRSPHRGLPSSAEIVLGLRLDHWLSLEELSLFDILLLKLITINDFQFKPI